MKPSESKKHDLTIAYKEAASGMYIGIVEEIPGAASQGKDLEELTTNLRKAVLAIFEANKLEAEQKKGYFFNNEDVKKLDLCM